jgi:hypothetical protein
MVSTAFSAFFRTSSGAIPARGCGIVTKRGAEIPLAIETDLANDRNASLQMMAVGIPLFSNSVESWILHDVQEPQSQIP